jgi:hypothetical protein
LPARIECWFLAWLRVACAGTLVLFLTSRAAGLEITDAPSRSREMARVMEAASFVEIEPGLAVLAAKDLTGTAIFAFRIDQDRFRFDLALQEVPDGERVDVLGPRAGAVFAVNGGFFGEKAPEKGLYPVGLLRIAGRDLSPNWKTTGGYLLFGPSALSIAPSSAQPPNAPQTMLQSKPLMIAPGGRWVMNTNQQIARPRTMVCMLPDGHVVLLAVIGTGLSLFEAGWLLRDPSDGGRFGCDSALALDGGGSTQLWVAGRTDLSFAGETTVHNALVLMRR